MSRSAAVAAFAFVTLAACSSGDGGTEPDEVELPQGSMSARIDGAAWQATTALSTSRSAEFITIVGIGGSTTMGITIGALTGTGTYPIGVSGAPTNALLTEGTRSWHAFSQVGSGTVTLTAVSATAATGSFTFTAPPVPASGASGNRVVTQGVFDVTF